MDRQWPVSYTHLDVYKRQVWVCGACAKPRAITADHLIDGAQLVGAATAVEAMVNGAQTLSF